MKYNKMDNCPVNQFYRATVRLSIAQVGWLEGTNREMMEERAGIGTIRRERRDAQENRRHILAVAKQLFDTKGVDSTSMHEIALTAGVGQGTLYRHFPHKGDLCHALIRDDIAAFEERVGARLADVQIPPLDRLQFLLVERVRITESHLRLFPAMEDSWREARRRERVPSRGRFDEWMHARIVSLLSEAIAWGDVAPVDTAFTADAMLAAVAPGLYSYQRQQGGYSMERIIAGLLDLFVCRLRQNCMDVA